VGTAPMQLAHERKAQAGGATGDGHSQLVHGDTLQVKVNLKSSPGFARLPEWIIC
jgi:hypothetical protein